MLTKFEQYCDDVSSYLNCRLCVRRLKSPPLLVLIIQIRIQIPKVPYYNLYLLEMAGITSGKYTRNVDTYLANNNGKHSITHKLK